MKSNLVFALTQIPGVARKTASRVLRHLEVSDYDRPEDIIDCFREAKKSHPRVPIPTVHEVEGAITSANEIVSRSSEMGIGYISYIDSEFPVNLKAIPDKPLFLFYKGNLNCVKDLPAVAIIGTRTPSEKGYAIARRLGEIMARNEIVVVSGLAVGCDSGGHIGCLSGNGITVAALPCGLDRIYPKNNSSLAEEIIESGGALISEYPIETTPNRNYFVERDRLQSGLSKAVIVIETRVKGGTMHTAGFAQKQERILACMDRASDEDWIDGVLGGNQYLIKEKGAFPLRNQLDLTKLIAMVTNGVNSTDRKDNAGIPKDDSGDQLRLF